MILPDYHMHSFPLSPDARDSMEAMAEAAYKRGVTHVCFTNHVEDCSMTTDRDSDDPFYRPFTKWDEMYREFAAVRDKFRGRMDIRLGAEVSSPHYIPEKGSALYSRGELDFVIGSIHNLRHRRDFYWYDYTKIPDLRPDIEEYLDENLEMVRSGSLDVVGHVGYMQKYMSYQGRFMDMMDYEERLRALFTLAAERGVGIEVNTSALNSPLKNFAPGKELIRLYRECGGEIVTAGSDSHTVDAAGTGITEALELLRECGFRYVAIYKEHKPEMIKI